MSAKLYLDFCLSDIKKEYDELVKEGMIEVLDEKVDEA